MSEESTCDHQRRVWVKYDDIDDGDDYYSGPSGGWETQSTMEDIDVGRMKCSMCGAIEYYTGQWKDYFEKGIPCLGSDKVKRT